MALRRQVWPGSRAPVCLLCQCQLRGWSTSMAIALNERSRARSSIMLPVSHRSMASHAFSDQLPPEQLLDGLPPQHSAQETSLKAQDPSQYPRRLFERRGDELSMLFSALRKPHAVSAVDAVLRWLEPLEGNPNSPAYRQLESEILNLPAPQFSEILRSVDPQATIKTSIVGDMLISPGEARMTGLGSEVDERGVRRDSAKLFGALMRLATVRTNSAPEIDDDLFHGQDHQLEELQDRHELQSSREHRGRHRMLAADYEIIMRCAGAASDWQGARDAWSNMAHAGDQSVRTVKTWIEFLKARYMTDPMYRRFDRASTVLNPRDRHTQASPIFSQRLARLDNLRYTLNAHQREPWNRSVEQPERDLRRLVRDRTGFRSFLTHWNRTLRYGNEIDEELLCVALVAFARAGDISRIESQILAPCYGVNVESQPAQSSGGSRQYVISGGRDFPPDALLKPTPQLLSALVDSMGILSNITLGVKLVDFFSKRYDLAIPDAVWSNILAWTYVLASKPIKTAHATRKLGPELQLTGNEVKLIWDMMTSPPFNVKPTFEDYDRYIKTLIVLRQYDEALELIRTEMVPFYHSLRDDYRDAVHDEILRNGTSASTNSSSSIAAHRRRRRADVQKTHVHFRINHWFTQILKAHKGARRRDPIQGTHFAGVSIPDMLLEFGEFFDQRVSYRLTDASVVLYRPGAPSLFRTAKEERTTLPAKISRSPIVVPATAEEQQQQQQQQRDPTDREYTDQSPNPDGMFTPTYNPQDPNLTAASSPPANILDDDQTPRSDYHQHLWHIHERHQQQREDNPDLPEWPRVQEMKIREYVSRPAEKKVLPRDRPISVPDVPDQKYWNELVRDLRV